MKKRETKKPTMENLIHNANFSAELRGHCLGEWFYNSSSSAECECLDCGMEVQVLLHPKPNEVQIGGTAVSSNCTGW